MATIRKEIPLNTPAERVWDIVRDIGAIHTRFAPGFVTHTQLEEGARARLVTFANGYVARELIVTLDERDRRLAYSVVGGVATHHNSSFQVIPTGPNHTTLVWITDMLPDAAADKLGPMIEAGSSVIQRTLDAQKTAAA
jgi:hypothetical protein